MRSIAEWKKRSKYNATKRVIDGIRFDSIKEATRYEELKLLEKAGKIKDLKLQQPFILQEGFKDNRSGKRIRSIKYVADYVYEDTESGEKFCEDCKGYRTDVYKIKRKMFLKKFGQIYNFIET